jgi:uncharacterized repeat protein (TIGR01451 family)
VWITNTYSEGCLEVTKIVDWHSVTPDTGQNFTVTVTGPSHPSPGISHVFGSSGGIWTLDDLIPGTYWVNETDPGSDWIVTPSLSQTVTVDPGTPCTQFSIVNTFNPGCLEITKTVDWGTFSPDTGQTFTVFVTGPSHPTGISHVFGYTGGTWILNDLIPGTYTIVETDPGLYWIVTPGLSQTVTVDPGTPCASISITNTYDPCTELIIEKFVWNGTDWTDNVRVPVGEFLNFKITVTNIGQKPATNIIVTDTLASPQLEYRNQANHTPDSESSNLVIWSFDILQPGESIEITYIAETVHTCYGWNLVNVTIPGCGSYEDEVIVKVVLDGQPIIDIKKQVWDVGKQDWTDNIARTIGSTLTFRLTINSTALDTIYDINIVDNLPDLLEYRYSSSHDEEYVSDDLHQVIWNFESIERGENIEITYDSENVQEGFGSNTANIQASGFLYDEDSVFIQSVDAPLVQLSYPKGGEILSNIVNIKWFAIDSDDTTLDIYLYYSTNNGETWMQIDGVFQNYDNEGHGEYSWDTTKFSDDEYLLMIQVVNDFNGISYDESNEFIIDNGNAGIKISDIEINDITNNNYNWVKNGDSVIITAAITGHDANTLTNLDITADLSGLGGNFETYAESFDGFLAKWTLDNVICSPSDGPINVIVNIHDDISNTGIINADNTIPELEITHPLNGLYIINRRFLPLMKTIIIGAVTIEIDANDISGINHADFYINDDLMKTVSSEPFSWNMNMKLMGQNTILKVNVFDSAGNSASISKELKVFNFFGI